MRAGAEPYRPDLFEQFGTVFARRMFGALGLFSGDVMVGIVIDDAIYLKTDEATRPRFIAEGMEPFVYHKHTGEEIVLSYYAVPDRLYDEPEEFAQWVRAAYAIAERSPAVQKKRGMTGKPARAKRVRA